MAIRFHYIRATSLIGYAAFFRQHGGDPERLLRDAGLPADSLDHTRQLLPCANFARLLEITAAALKNRDSRWISSSIPGPTCRIAAR